MASPIIWENPDKTSPPVGCRCRYKLNGGKNWFDCEIIAYHGEGPRSHVWVAKRDDKVDAKPIMRLNEVTFKPLVSHKGLLVNEAKLHILNSRQHNIKCDFDDIKLIKCMIDLGYRLVPEVPKEIQGLYFYEGDDQASNDGFTAGIHAPNHGNMIEVYGSKVHAVATRDYVLQLMSLNNPDLT